MPFQRSSSAASTQLLFKPPSALGPSDFASSSAAIVPSKSALAESSFKPRDPSLGAQEAAPARKQHHVSFQEQPEHAEPQQKPNRRRERSHRSSQSSSRPDASESNTKGSEQGSAKQSASRASSRHSRNDPSEPESSKSAGAESALTTSTRSRRQGRRGNDKRSDRSQRAPSEAATATTDPTSVSRPNSRAATSTKSEASTSASRRDPRSREPSASGRSSRNHSNHAGILPDLRLQDASRSESVARSQHSASSRRDRFSTRSHDTRSVPGDAPTARDGRQLFDPRRDDPVKFASQQRLQTDERARAGSSVSSPRLASASSLQPQIPMRRDPSESSRASLLARSPIIKPSIADVAFTPAIDPADPRALQAHVLEIKKVYRSISAMETALQEAHHAEADKARLAMAEYVPPDVRDPSYWITMISRHRSLADLHSSFFEMTCRPELPRSVQELAETYNLPSRLWQNAFHLMLESLRSNLASQPPHQPASRKTELLDYLTEFIYFAYSFYSALHESERYKNFGRAWIESLGDLSRYRMAVASLAASMAIDGGGEEIRNKAHDGRSPVLALDARIDDAQDDSDGDADDDDDSLDEHRAEANGADARRRHARRRRSRRGHRDDLHNVDKASIGSAALGDWEWTEKETWRQTAKDWYALGITQAPNIGRLHHHLGVLSRGEDDLRALYHLSKSLIASKPFSSAKDSVVALFDQERQSRRIRRGSSVGELFLYLHGLLITRVQLDDFEPVFDRFMTDLTALVEEHGPAGLPQSVWTMMATVNIAGLFEHGSDDSMLADLLLQQSHKSGKRPNRTERSRANVPTAILVSTSATKTDDNLLSELPRDAEWDDPSDDEDEAGEQDGQLIALDAKARGDEAEAEAANDLPDTLERAARLCFSMQALTFDLTSADASLRSNPYNTTIGTFLLSLCQSKRAFRLFERFVPWDSWLQRLESSIGLAERGWPKMLASPYITAQLLLPEDYCLRGILGLSRHLYDRHLWRPTANEGGMSASHAFANEVEVLDAEDGELYTRIESAWRTAAARKGERDEASATLDTVRIYRMAFVARKLAKAGRGFELDGKTSKLSLSKMLQTRLVRRKMEEEQRELEARIQQLRLQAANREPASARFEEPAAAKYEEPARSDDEDDFDSDWEEDEPAAARERTHSLDAILPTPEGADASDEIQALHARSCYLRDVLSSVRSTLTRGGGGSHAAKERGTRVGRVKTDAAASACENIVPGYTVLVVDTNIIVTPGEVIAQLIESQRWTLIIPLAVITELDGLRRNDSELGRHAERAIRLLETRIRTHAKFVKVQTSRGNYLSDLSCRSEDIDFAWQGQGAGAAVREEDAADTKSVAARNVDEVILRILAWQRDNFVDRRNLLQPTAARKHDEPATRIDSAHKSVLLTLDRNLRLKAKSRGLPSVDSRAAAALLELP
ncbi:hypothetical protein PaG_04161 [Moesziomyces aphidis]|uniref:PIN domain-containing protein n=1 Tax=Moesziomyces aphidis TaxID=84754 RepID=W3VJ10_MOEAP|nr:hypothetical protein PaG_04161 [Moesziomyces aphidis]